MVEFALAFVVFVFFVLFVFDIALVIYNQNLYHDALVRGARAGALGGSNSEIRETVGKTLSDHLIPTIFFASAPGEISISPSAEIERVDGREVTLSTEISYGLFTTWPGQLTISLPVKTNTLIVQHNDQDRDGCKDELAGEGVDCEGYQFFEDTYREDHANDGVQDAYLFGGPGEDADGDGNPWYADTIAIGYTDGSEGTCESGYYLYRPNDSPLGSTCEFGGIDGWDEELETDGWYHAPEIWDDGSEASPKLFERRLPSWGVENTDRAYIIRELRTAHDKVNNGWVNKFDSYPDEVDRW